MHSFLIAVFFVASATALPAPAPRPHAMPSPLPKTYSPMFTRLSEAINNKQIDRIAMEQLSLFKHATDPEILMGPAELIQYWGYPVERHDVTTEDGYILSVYRIPHGINETASDEKKPVVFFMHGLEGSSTNWLTNLPNESAAYIYADAGFDVWLGNFRGTTYSKTHATLSNKDHAYWQFSWDEMAQYDLPAMLYQTLNVTGADSLYYIGHSMGTMTAFAKFSEDQVLAKRVKRFYALGPVHTLGHVEGIMKKIAPFTRIIQDFFKLIGLDEFLPNSPMTDWFAEYVCGNPIGDAFCTNLLFAIGGPDTHQMNATRMPVYIAHTPAGTSTQNIAHFGQMVNSGKFDKFDWGNPVANNKHYGQRKPPTYDITKMETPVGLYWGAEDYLADPTDVKDAIPLIKNLIANVYLDDFNHLDFIWGLRAAPEIYQPILEAILEDYHS